MLGYNLLITKKHSRGVSRRVRGSTKRMSSMSILPSEFQKILQGEHIVLSDLLEKITGIYGIRNLETKRVYVGQSINILARILDHTNNLHNRRHPCLRLQDDVDIFGLRVFEAHLIDAPVQKRHLLYLESQTICNILNQGGSVYNSSWSFCHPLHEKFYLKYKETAKIGYKKDNSPLPNMPK